MPYKLGMEATTLTSTAQGQKVLCARSYPIPDRRVGKLQQKQEQRSILSILYKARFIPFVLRENRCQCICLAAWKRCHTSRLPCVPTDLWCMGMVHNMRAVIIVAYWYVCVCS